MPDDPAVIGKRIFARRVMPYEDELRILEVVEEVLAPYREPEMGTPISERLRRGA